MNFYPCSRYLLVKTIREESVEEEQRVLLPEGYTPSKKEFGAYMVVSAAPEVALSVFPGEVVVVEESMVREINFQGETHLIVLENYVCGVLSPDGKEEFWEDCETV